MFFLLGNLSGGRADPDGKVRGAISRKFGSQVSYYRESCFHNCRNYVE